jgi:hypothetical protein
MNIGSVSFFDATNNVVNKDVFDRVISGVIYDSIAISGMYVSADQRRCRRQHTRYF